MRNYAAWLLPTEEAWRKNFLQKRHLLQSSLYQDRELGHKIRYTLQLSIPSWV